ncbi:hypothetical protein HMPREF1981_00916 [Bacteroides pyogenes F0041]|uniref:Toxin-antitoxin system, toxin component, MazF family n=2 Tax=Bacteroides pyogenes TaxID=310300 RepID=U2E276_9BACE|nr:hypothetical protein HMPREF1981_00916 [Bacteroides pyogenes F0041]
MKPSEIKIGDVFRITMNKANGVVPKPGDTSRNKYFVVLGFDDDGNVYGGVIFNSYININLPPFVQAMQHPVKGKDYEFLSHDSYIDCSSIKAVKKNKLLKSSSLGTLNTEDVSSVCEKIKHNSRISKIELKRFGLL